MIPKYVKNLLGKNEQIVFATRRHVIALWVPAVGNLCFLFVLLIVPIYLSAREMEFAYILYPLTLYPMCIFAKDLLRWWNERYFITNRRVIQAEGIINKRVIDSSLEKVNDVILVQTLLGRILNYGNVEILTASEIGVNDLRTILDPVRFKTEMLNQREALGINEGIVNTGSKKPEEIPSILNMLDNLRKQNLLTQEEFENKRTQLLKGV